MSSLPSGLLHAVRVLARGQVPPGLAKRWPHLLGRQLVKGSPDAPALTPLGLAFAGRAAERARLDDTESYFTSGWIVEQGLRLVIPAELPRPTRAREALRIVDLGTGGGPFGQRARLIAPHAIIMGVELREEERPAARHYDEFLVGDMFDLREKLARFRPHFVVSNPPFTHTRRAGQLALDIVVPGGEVLFLLRADWGGAAKDWDWLLEHGPAHEYACGGRPSYRSRIGREDDEAVNDLQGAKWLRWRAYPFRNSTGEWPRRMLPRLPSAALSWTERPGTEAVVSPLPSIYYPEEIP